MTYNLKGKADLSMEHNYKHLLEVQELDIKLLELKKTIDSIPAEISELEKTNANEKKDVEKVKAKIKELILKIKDLENQVESKREHSNKLKSQLNLVKKNDEYTALNNEIKTDLKSIKQMEDEIIEIMANEIVSR